MRLMIHRLLRTPIALVAIGLAWAISSGQAQQERAEPRSAPMADQFMRRHGPGWTVRLSADRQRIASVVGLGTRAYGERPETAARSFLVESAQMFGLRQDLGDLQLISQASNAAGGHVEYQQQVNQLPVENAKGQR